MREEFNPGVPLGDYRKIGAGVLLTCRDCLQHRSLDLEKVIRRLEVQGLGGASTGIRAVADFVREACPRCGGRCFESRPDFKPMVKDGGSLGAAP
jgi:hypothetical protein